jgi:hypothetical protein
LTTRPAELRPFYPGANKGFAQNSIFRKSEE